MTPEQPAPPDLRPLGIGETLDVAFRMLRQNFGTFLKIAALFAAVPAVLNALYGLNNIELIVDGQIFVQDPDAYNLTVSLLGILGLFVQLLAAGVLVHLSTRLYMNHEETVGSILSGSSSRLAAFVGMSILLGLYAFGVFLVAALVTTPFGIIGAIALLCVFVAFFTMYSLSPPAFWHEGLSATKAIGRSSSLVRARFWPVLGALALAFIVLWVFTIGLGILIFAIFFNVESVGMYVLLTAIVDFFGTIIGLLPMAPIITVVYFDNLVRQEGLDMKLKMGDNPDPPEEPPPAVPW